MNKFQVGDIVRRVGGVRFFIIRKTFEGFCQAQIYAILSPNKGFPKKTLTHVHVSMCKIDDLSVEWVKEENLVKNKFELNERIFYLPLTYSRVKAKDTVPGIVIGYIPEYSGYKGKVTYKYYIQSDDPDDSMVVLPEHELTKNINTNKLWNELCQNSN